MQVLNGHTGAVVALLSAGAATDATDNEGRTPLDLAVKYHRVDTVATLRAAMP